MKKLESLSEEQIQKMNEVKNYWLDYIFSCKNQTNREQAKVQIEWLYKFCKKDSPIIIFVDSPMSCQFAVQYLKILFKKLPQVGDQVGAQVGDQVGDQVRAQVWAQVGAQVWDQVGDQVGAQIMAQVWDQVRAQVGDQVGAQVGDQYESFCSYGSISDYGWVSFHDFFMQIGVTNHSGFKEFKSLLQSGIYDTIQLNGFCIVSNMPDNIKRNGRGRLHNENGSAIHFRDGYELYYWNGLCVPKSWIMDKDSITKDTIVSESNAEKRRCLREIIGAKKYYDLITDGHGLDLLDEDTDKQGNLMRLYQTKKPDSLLNKKVQFIECVCPSTMRVYNIYPPRQKSKNVWEAKADTFGKTQKEFNPVFES